MRLRKINYERATIEQIQLLMKTKLFTEIIFDGDNKTICFLEEEVIEVEKKMDETANNIIESIKPTLEKLAETFIEASKTLEQVVANAYNSAKDTVNKLYGNIKPLMNKKINKKKFIKLLQSQGIQRNEINKIIENNRESYTYLRLYTIINDYEKKKIENNNK